MTPGHDVDTLCSQPGHPLISVVVIGRNEGERLRRCLASVHAADWHGLPYELVYVDSASSDGSAGLARRMDARVLHAGQPPTAAAGRNIGWHAASADTVLFLDGDTVLAPGFPALAYAALYEGRYAAVWGHRRELAPCQSVYTAVLDLDWVYPPGESAYCGGDALFRRSALLEAGGFDGSLAAGEEPELCRRLRAKGWHILHVDAPMTGHDLAITRFSQYWRRAVRSGQAYAQVAARYGASDDPLWRRECRRNLLHGTAVVLAPAALAATTALLPQVAGALLASGALLMLRSAARARAKAGSWRLALLYALHSHAQKVPILYGQLHCAWQRRQGREPGLLEYKADAPAGSHAGRTSCD